MVASMPLRLLLSVLQSALGLLRDVANLRLGGAQVLVDRALDFLRVIAGYAPGHLLHLARSFLHSAVNLVFIDSHKLSLP
jgi:hypothetical protein